MLAKSSSQADGSCRLVAVLIQPEPGLFARPAPAGTQLDLSRLQPCKAAVQVHALTFMAPQCLPAAACIVSACSPCSNGRWALTPRGVLQVLRTSNAEDYKLVDNFSVHVPCSLTLMLPAASITTVLLDVQPGPDEL